MSVGINGLLVKITSAGTVSIPKQFRRHMDMQKGDYVKVFLENDQLVIRKVSPCVEIWSAWPDAAAQIRGSGERTYREGS